MKELSRQRCFNHAQREAVARCLECGRFYCRECVTEHENRVLCAACLRAVLETDESPPFRWGPLFRLLQGMGGLFLVWLCFYLVGQSLLLLPSSLHEGTLWRQWEELR